MVLSKSDGIFALKDKQTTGLNAFHGGKHIFAPNWHRQEFGYTSWCNTHLSPPAPIGSLEGMLLLQLIDLLEKVEKVSPVTYRIFLDGPPLFKFLWSVYQRSKSNKSNRFKKNTTSALPG